MAISILVECPIETLPAAETAVGIDAGITSLVTLSTGEKVTNPKHERRDRARLAKRAASLSRKAKGSANRAKARLKVARRTPGSPTGAGTCSTNCPRGSSAKTKR